MLVVMMVVVLVAMWVDGMVLELVDVLVDGWAVWKAVL